jgi:guanylate kinase
MIDAGQFLEYACYVDNYYGSPLEPIERKLADGFDVLLEIEVQGGLQIMEKRPDAISIFLIAPSFAELAARLRGRGDTDGAVIPKRLETARREYGVAPQYDYIVVNDRLEDAVSDVLAILRSESLRAGNQLEKLKEADSDALSPDE